jgi:hypothetical protein
MRKTKLNINDEAHSTKDVKPQRKGRYEIRVDRQSCIFTVLDKFGCHQIFGTIKPELGNKKVKGIEHQPLNSVRLSLTDNTRQKKLSRNYI